MLLAILVMAAVSGQPGADPGPPPPAAAKISAPPPTAKASAVEKGTICKKEKVLGSMLPVARCYDAADYKRRQQDNREWLEKSQREVPLKGE